MEFVRWRGALTGRMEIKSTKMGRRESGEDKEECRVSAASHNIFLSASHIKLPDLANKKCKISS